MSNEISEYDKWKLRDQSDTLKVYSYCEQCGSEIYYREEYVEFSEVNLHEDCLDNYIEDRIARKVAE